MEAFVACIVPFVWSQKAHGVDVHPVSQFAVVDEMLVRVAEQGIFSDFGETQLVEMLVDVPFPNDIAFPVDFDEAVV